MNRLKIGRFAGELTFVSARFVEQHLKCSTDAGTIEGLALLLKQLLQNSQSLPFHLFGGLVLSFETRRTRPSTVFEGKRGREPDLADKLECRFEVRLSLPREADNEIR